MNFSHPTGVNVVVVLAPFEADNMRPRPLISGVGYVMLYIQNVATTFCHHTRWNIVSWPNRFNNILPNTNEPRNGVPFVLKMGISISAAHRRVKIFWAFLARGHAGRRRYAMLEAMEADNGDQTLWLVEWWYWGGGVEFGMPGW